MRVVGPLRVAVLVALALLVLLGLPGAPSPAPEGTPAPREVEVQGFVDSVPGSDSAWSPLLRHAAEAPLWVRLPGEPGSLPPSVLLSPPHRLRAERPAALGVEARDAVRLTLRSPAGVTDSLEVKEGGVDAFVLRPSTPGAVGWDLTVEGEGVARVGGWVEPPRPLRVLVLSGLPTSESRMAMRALEEAGEEVRGRIHLGRDLWVGAEGAPGSPEEGADLFSDVDVAVLFPGIDLSEERGIELRSRVREGGMGLLLAGGAGPSAVGSDLVPEGWVEGLREESGLRGDGLVWALPAEISPLPEADVEVRVLLRDGEAVPLFLTTVGRGRAGALLITDTWRWRMEAEAREGHRRFWQSAVEWLSGGWVHEPLLEPRVGDGRVGDVVRIRVLAREGEGPGEAPAVSRLEEGGLEVTGPAVTDTLPLAAAPSMRGLSVAEASFVPPRPGPYRVRYLDEVGEDRGPGVGVVIRGVEEPGLDPAGRLARLAQASPGGGVFLGVDGGGLEAQPGTRNLLPPLFVLLLVALFTEWLLRRLSGRP